LIGPAASSPTFAPVGFEHRAPLSRQRAGVELTMRLKQSGAAHVRRNIQVSWRLIPDEANTLTGNPAEKLIRATRRLRSFQAACASASDAKFAEP